MKTTIYAIEWVVKTENGNYKTSRQYSDIYNDKDTAIRTAEMTIKYDEKGYFISASIIEITAGQYGSFTKTIKQIFNNKH